jgi:hypothetical protein
MTHPNPAEFFDDFGVEAVFRDVYPVLGQFEQPYVNVNLGAGVESTEPSFTCPEAKVPNVLAGDSLAIGRRHYGVVRVEPDGHGIVRLVLERTT